QFPYSFGNEQYSDDLWKSLEPASFYNRMRTGEQAQTAQIAMTTFQEAFTNAARSGVPTVYLGFSSGLSGTFGTAEMIRDQVLEEYPEAELYVVDTLLASIAEGLLVYEAFRQRELGLTAQEMVAWANEARYFVNNIFMVDDLESLRAGGRIPASVAYAGAKLDVKPLLQIALDGSLSMRGIARGRKKGIRQMVQFFEENFDASAPEHLAVVGHSDCGKDAEKFKDSLSKANSTVMYLDSNLGPVIGSHVGPGMLAVVFWGKDRREDLSVADRIARKVRGE
ncbi:MAG: DegV family protein, partial [Eggerthellaceae bacterium]|nr:DegV family protein [Eggerthellaceae bacterium]